QQPPQPSPQLAQPVPPWSGPGMPRTPPAQALQPVCTMPAPGAGADPTAAGAGGSIAGGTVWARRPPTPAAQSTAPITNQRKPLPGPLNSLPLISRTPCSAGAKPVPRRLLDSRPPFPVPFLAGISGNAEAFALFRYRSGNRAIFEHSAER